MYTPKRKTSKRTRIEQPITGVIPGFGFGVAGTVLAVCCCCILCVLAILGAVAFGLVVGLENELNEFRYCMDLTGCKELPPGTNNPPACVGDEDGFAFAIAILNKDSVCINILIDDISLPVESMHIHGPLTVDDPGNAGIFIPQDGTSSFDVTVDESGTGVRIVSCESVTKDRIEAITANPHLFYLNVHNGPFPAGALRDQLGNGCRD